MRPRAAVARGGAQTVARYRRGQEMSLPHPDCGSDRPERTPKPVKTLPAKTAPAKDLVTPESGTLGHPPFPCTVSHGSIGKPDDWRLPCGYGCPLLRLWLPLRV